VLQSKQSALLAQLLVLSAQVRSSLRLDSPLQLSKLHDVTPPLQAYRSQKLKEE
jgi:hypothetical protein